MNITITQDNSRVEVLGSNGASIIQKLYELAIDPNNTLTLEGNISSTAAYADQVTYLTTNYPDLIINATNLYIRFEDSKAAAVCSEYFGDGTGCTATQLATADFTKSINGTSFATAFKNAGVQKFNELQYCTNITDTSIGGSWLLQDNTTLQEITLPSSCITVKSYTFKSVASAAGALDVKINGANNIRVIESYGFWGWDNSDDFNTKDTSKNRLEIDWRNITSCAWEYFYATSDAFKGVVILPKNPTDQWLSSRNFSVFGENRGGYITKVVFPETFTCKNISGTQMKSCDYLIFLTLTPCNGEIALWRNKNWGAESSCRIFFPDSLYNQLDASVLADTSYGSKQYTPNIKITYGSTPEPLSNYANISDANKDELLSYGCTATGSTGNWTIKAPGEA